MAEALREELLAVPGIAGAEVDSDRGVAGVRVQLAVGADPNEVEAAVRQILALHGMRPAGAEADDGVGPPPPPGAPGSVVSFPLIGEHAPEDATSVATSVVNQLESVSVEETPDGIAVAVRGSDSRSSVQHLEAGMTDLDAGIVAAVAELVDETAALVGVNEAQLGEQLVVTVLLSRQEDSYCTGSAVQVGGRAFAIARASWRALTERV